MKIILIEGFCSYNFLRILQRAYLKTLKNEFPEAKIKTLPYTYTGPLIADVVIGHSFGGGRAILSNTECELLITIDARRWKFWLNDKFESPLNPGLHVNFYQAQGLRGYRVLHNNKVGRVPKKYLNYLIENTTHGKIPSVISSAVIELINAALDKSIERKGHSGGKFDTHL